MASRSVLGLTLLVAVAPLSCGLVVSFDGYDTSGVTRLLAIGGTVDGLEGAQVTLTINGKGEFPEVGNGAFSFPGAIPDRSDYELRAAAPGHTCTVERGVGRADGADVVGVVVQCLSSEATLTSIALSGATLEPAFDPAVRAYRARVPWAVDATVTATTRSPRGRYRIADGAPLGSGMASAMHPYRAH